MNPDLENLLAQVNVETTVTAVPRNNIAAATAFYEKNAPITSQQARVLLRLQDDPAELLNLMATWEVVDDQET